MPIRDASERRGNPRRHRLDDGSQDVRPPIRARPTPLLNRGRKLLMMLFAIIAQPPDPGRLPIGEPVLEDDRPGRRPRSAFRSISEINSLRLVLSASAD
jgi:hypothetical protein